MLGIKFDLLVNYVGHTSSPWMIWRILHMVNPNMIFAIVKISRVQHRQIVVRVSLSLHLCRGWEIYQTLRGN
jgi:hypothetical protein